MTRGFQSITTRKADVKLPERSTKNSAGYDFFAPEDVVIKSSVIEWLTGRLKGGDQGAIAPTLVKTGVKAYMMEDEMLALYNRSSNPKKMGLILANSVGVVDSDYYNNPDNEGEIGFLFYNIFPWNVTIHKGDKIGQGVFSKFLTTDDDNATGDRTGGFGSTGK